MEGSRTEKLEKQKSQILDFIKSGGPNIPVKISSHLGIDSFIASAFLSELLSERKLKLSKLKVGNSPLYFIPGQEESLQEFSKFLGNKEREAYDLLKDKQILLDVSQHPAIRVALRSLKDFAIPFNFQGKVFWRYFTISQDESIKLLENELSGNKKEEKLENKETISKDNQKDMGETGKLENKAFVNPFEDKNKRKKPKFEEEFVPMVKSLFNNLNAEIIQDFGFKRKEYNSVINFNGKKYLCSAKDKKLITYSDVNSLLEKGKKLNLPVMIVSSGELNPKAKEWVNYFQDFVIFKKIDY